MQIKTLEVRDKGTCIPVMAFRMKSENAIQAYYMQYRSGHPADGSSVVVMILSDMRATNDPYEWPTLGLGHRTMPNAHQYIIDTFDLLADGDVVDVEVILGETTEPKKSERFATAED